MRNFYLDWGSSVKLVKGINLSRKNGALYHVEAPFLCELDTVLRQMRQRPIQGVKKDFHLKH